jgi:chromosome segregation ATPase
MSEAEDDDRRWILVEQMASTMQGMSEGIAQIPSLVEGVAALRSDVTEIKGELVVHGQILKEHSAILKEHSAILGQHSEDITELKSDITELKSDVTELKSDVTELKSDVKEIKRAVVGVQATSHAH